MQVRIPILLGGAAAVVAGLVLVRMVPVDAPIPAGYASVVEDARTTLHTRIDGGPGLGFERLECTADGGYVVWFRGSFPLGGEQFFYAHSTIPYAVGNWGGDLAESLGDLSSLQHEPIVACA